jgi:heme-degrading monooxygenase HmoA
MFITVYTYRARSGESEAIIAIHEEWGKTPDLAFPGFFTRELLRSLEDPHEFVDVLRFESEPAARDAERSGAYAAWYSRLLERLDAGPSYSHFHTVCVSRSVTPPADRLAVEG